MASTCAYQAGQTGADHRHRRLAAGGRDPRVRHDTALFFLAAIDALSEAEVLREETDEDESSADEEGLEDALDGEPHALLLPMPLRSCGATTAIGAKPEEPEPDWTNRSYPAQRHQRTARRTFYTDSARRAISSRGCWPSSPRPTSGIISTKTRSCWCCHQRRTQLYAAYRQVGRRRAASFRGSRAHRKNHSDIPDCRPLRGDPRRDHLAREATIRRRLDVLPCIDFDRTPITGGPCYRSCSIR